MKLLEMLISRQYALKKRVLYFVYGLRGSVKNCIWLALILAVWESIFEGLEGNLLVYILTKVSETLQIWNLQDLNSFHLCH